MFIIGHLGGKPRREIFPITGSSGQTLRQLVGGTQGYRVYDPTGTSVTIASQTGGMGRETGLYAVPDIKCINQYDENGKQRRQQERVYSAEGNMVALCSQMGGRFNVAIPVLTPDRTNKKQNGRRFKTDGEPMFTLTAQDRHGVAIINKQGKLKKNNTKGQCASTLTGGGNSGGNHSDMDLIMETETKISEESLDQLCDSIRECMNSIVERGGGEGVLEKPSHIPGPDDVNNTIRASGRGSLTAKHNHDTIHDGVRFRRLTPLECFRLQGFPDEHFHNAKAAGVSDSQLYKQAGNAVTVTVVYEIAKRLG